MPSEWSEPDRPAASDRRLLTPFSRGTPTLAPPSLFARDARQVCCLWAGVGCTMLGYRALLVFQASSADPNLPVRIAKLLMLLPLVIYQDLVLLVVLAAASAFLCRGASRSARVHRPLGIAVWVVALGLSLYAALSWRVYDAIHSLPSYQLWRRSQGFHGIHEWFEGPAVLRSLLVLLAGPALTLLGAWLSGRILASKRLRRVHVGPLLGASAVLLYAAAAGLACRRLETPPLLARNPHWAGLVSIVEGIPTLVPAVVADADPALADFHPAGHRLASRPGPAVASGAPENVLIVVLESVAARYVDGFGSAKRLTPEIRRLAEHGIRYRRISANQPWSSSALTALVCSVYPLLEWETLSSRMPELAVPGLPGVLRPRGYRTALFTTAYYHFEGNDVFCLHHGFELLRDDIRESHPAPAQPGGRWRTHEDRMADLFFEWVDRAAERPFCAMLWTSITHSPYAPTGPLTPYDQRSPYRTRYFNAITQSDRMLGDLVRGLARRGLLERTLLVVVGDHGEGFDEHGSMGHGACLYEEAVHVPLLIYNPRRFPRPEVSDVLGQQIDVAPTVLDLLAIPAPPLWQGRSLRSAQRPPRIYSFSAWDQLTFGVREGDWKYTAKPGTAWEELYDLASDPGERRNRAGDPALRARVAQLRHRLDAWRGFQDGYWARAKVNSSEASGAPAEDDERPLGAGKLRNLHSSGPSL